MAVRFCFTDISYVILQSFHYFLQEDDTITRCTLFASFCSILKRISLHLFLRLNASSL